MAVDATQRFAAALVRRELLPWMLLGITLGMAEGATAAVLIKEHFTNAAKPAVNLAIAVVSGAPALANIVSFAWANLAHARARIPLLVGLQALFALSVGLIGLAPKALGGLLFTVLSIVIARVIWSGILTIRTSVWIANYPRQVLARMTSRIVIGGSVAIAVTSSLAALALAGGDLDTRLLYIAAALGGLCAAWLYRSMSMRHEFRWLREEAAAGTAQAAFSLTMVRQILRDDERYRRYMFYMGIYGGGALMLTSQLVVILSDQWRVSGALQILALTVIPLLTLPLFLPFWARLFDRSHTLQYRARQGRFMVGAVALMCLAGISGWPPLLWLGAVVLGIAMAGANLGWTFGHQDFAARGQAQQYMGVHVTLTGIRGLLAPPLGMLLYLGLEALHQGAGRYALLAPLVMTCIGAIGFNRMLLQKN